MNFETENKFQLIQSELDRLDKISSVFSILVESISNSVDYNIENSIHFLKNELSATTSELFELYEDLYEELQKDEKTPEYDYKSLEEIQKIWVNDYYSEN